MDPTAIGAIAAGAVSILSPYLTKAADMVVPKVAEDLYALLHSKLAKKPAAAEALQDLEKSPEDADAQAALRVQLKKSMVEDEELAGQVNQLVEAAGGTEGRTVSASNRGVAAGGDISGPVFTGDVRGDIDIGGSKAPRTNQADEQDSQPAK